MDKSIFDRPENFTNREFLERQETAKIHYLSE